VVKEWHEKKQKVGIKDQKNRRDQSFYYRRNNSSSHEPVQSVNEVNEVSKKRTGISLFAKYASLSSAAMIGLFI